MKVRRLFISLFYAGWVLILIPDTSAAQEEVYTYKLTQSSSNYSFWTTTPAEKVFQDDAVPMQTDSNVIVYAAKNEFEPFQIVVKPNASGNISVDIGDFGAGIETEIYQVKYVTVTQASDNLGRIGPNPDPLWPLEKNDSISVTANQNTAIWFSVYVPDTVTSGDYSANVQIAGVNIPVTLHVFNFSIPQAPNVKSQMNFSHNTILTYYGVPCCGNEYWIYVEKIKQDFNGGMGFPSFMAATFKNNDSSADQRPATFCGLTRTSSDWYTGDNANSAYNQKWFEYITGLRNYLNTQGYLDRAYYYFANEPQDQADYDAVAWYSAQLKNVAPDLKLMVSEEPKPEIYNHATFGGAKIDIWLSVLNNYDPTVSHAREAGFGEETWIYWLHGTRPPYFNPITLDHPGIESKLTGWFLWKYRVRGIVYYSLNNWSQNPWTNPLNDSHNGDLFMLYPPTEDNAALSYGENDHRFVPSIRFELMRDSLEDYEYFFILNGNAQPAVGSANSADVQVDKLIKGVAGYTRSSEFMYNMRRLIGLYIGGEISSIPEITPPVEHPRSEGTPGNYYINFQAPDGAPGTTYTADTYGNGYIFKYVTDAGQDYLQAGTEAYDATAGYGWLDDTAHFLTGRDPWGDEQDERKITYFYDDYAHHPSVFEFDLPNGTYAVEVSVGTPRRVRNHNRVVIEGVTFVDDEASDMYIVRTDNVTINDFKLTVDVGIWNEYTMLNYLDIEAVDIPQGPIADFSFDLSSGKPPLTVLFSDSSSNNPTTWQWDFNDDGQIDSTVQTPSFTYTKPGVYTVCLSVSNSNGSDSETKIDLVNVSRRLALSPIYLLLLE